LVDISGADSAAKALLAVYVSSLGMRTEVAGVQARSGRDRVYREGYLDALDFFCKLVRGSAQILAGDDFDSMLESAMSFYISKQISNHEGS